MYTRIFYYFSILGLFSVCLVQAKDAIVTHHYANNDGVKIHYVQACEVGPLVVMLHGFPDFMYSWNEQIIALKNTHRVVAMDLRGYNRSDKPKGINHYSITKLVSDVESVIRDLGQKKAVVVGHDWGGMVAWNFAMLRPQMTERLIVLNLPHPKALVSLLYHKLDKILVLALILRGFQRYNNHIQLNKYSLKVNLACSTSTSDCAHGVYVCIFLFCKIFFPHDRCKVLIDLFPLK